MMWLQVVTATVFGFACGFWLAAEIGRVIYNRKMDELRENAEEVRRLLGEQERIPLRRIAE